MTTALTTSHKALEFDKVLEHLARLCLSASGREAALALRPFATAHDAMEAALLYDECRIWSVAAQAHKKPFRMTSFPETGGIAGFLRSQRAILDIDALWTLREVLRMAQEAAVSILPTSESNNTVLWPRLVQFVENNPLPEALTAALQRCLSDDGHMRDESSPELLLVRTQLRSLHQSCMRKVKDFAAQYNILHYLQDEFMTLASDRYVLPLKANFKGRLQGIIHDWSQTGETCYFEPMFLVEINNNLQELKRQEHEEERKVMEYLTGLVRDSLPAVQHAHALLTRLDVLLSLAKLADAMTPATRAPQHTHAHSKKKVAPAPQECVCVTLSDIASTPPPTALQDGAPSHDLNAGHKVFLPAARHPLLALTSAAQPIDIMLNEGERGLVISGGNAGGKTVCLKTLGLIALMSMSGMPVPVGRGAIIPFWHYVHAFIGDEQSLDDNVSTFTAQIRHLTAAWETASSHSLILLDEFGAGTDPAQGAALAQAVLDALLDKDVTVVAATHFPALKTYALTREKARAASVLFDPSTKRPLFRLAYDQVGASQALDVAREHGLPESIVRRAEHYLLQDGEDTTALIERLNHLAVVREGEIESLKKEQEAQRQKRLRLDERFERERVKLYDEVRGKAQELMAAWKAGKVTHKQALKDMSRIRAQVANAPASHAELDTVGATKPLLETLRVGQSILHRSFGKKGTVCEVDARKKRVRMDMGGVTLWADVADLGTAPINDIRAPQKPTAPVKRTGVVLTQAGGAAPLSLSLRLDIRGKRADVALAELERFLDKALLGGRECVEIVHGRGTGVLRKEIHAFLRTFSAVESFELAPEDRGGDGMTMVTLR